MKYFFSILLISVININTFAQQKATEPVLNDLHIKWEVTQNNYNNKIQSLTALTLFARNKFTLPAKGWKLYFNFIEPVVPQSLTGNVTITHVNGDLYYMAPAADFKILKPNDSLYVQFVASNWLINNTDAPQGFYLVWDNAPTKCYAVNNITLKPSTQWNQFVRMPYDKVEVNTPQVVYEQNKAIGDIPADSLIKIFPTPVSYRQTKAAFKLDAGVNITSDAAFTTEAGYLKNELSKLLLPAPASKQTIDLIKEPMAPEAYTLSINNNRITITASTGAGIFYGIQSLKTLIPANAYQQKQKNIVLPGVNVTDGPRFGYRAVMLDVARNFQPKQEILKLLDVMALYKLNTLHFHLTDDEGWRIAINALPELTAIGAKRGHTLTNLQNLQPSWGSGPFTSSASGSGYYTQADFVEILKYATLHHIKIIPEIESPGHARAAIKAMDARYYAYAKQGRMQMAEQYLLHDRKDSSKYSSVQNWNDNVIDVSLPSTYRFIETVTAEIKKMYTLAGTPLQTIHYGGDEVPAGVWEGSPAYLRLAKTDTTIKSTSDLWAYYYSKVNTILKDKDLYLTAWEEVGLHKVMQNGKKVNVINPGLADKNIHLDVWNNVLGSGDEDLAYKLANRGYKVILSCVSNLYFDMAYNKAFDEPGFYWGGYADLDRSFKFIPYNYLKNSTKDAMGRDLNPAVMLTKESLTATGKENIIGLQGALWAETLKSPGKMEYMLLPKLLRLAERAWAAEPQWAAEQDTLKSKALYNEAWSRFVNVLGKQELQRLSYYAGGFNYRVPPVGAVSQNGTVMANAQFPGFKIHYTTDGTMPTINSMLYTAPVKAKAIIKLAVFNNAARSGKVVTVDNR